MIWIGVALVIIAFVLIIKRFEARVVLFATGFVMCLCAGQVLEPIEKFFSGLFSGNLPQIICSAVGYAALMGYGKCDQHLARALVKILAKIRPLIIPLVIIFSGLVTASISSNAGAAAAVGPIFIPVMVKAGIHPVMAASALALGCQANYFGFGSHPAMISEITGLEIQEIVIKYNWPVGAVCFLVVIACAVIIAKVTKTGSGYVDESGEFRDDNANAKINYYFAFLPFLPIIVVLLGVVGWIPKLSVQQAMVFSTMWAFITTRVSIKEAMNAYCAGLGRGLADVVSIIACAGVFTLGMEAIGLTPALIAMMESNPNIAIYAAAVGPLVIGFLCGSGDAATLAFNGSITPLASSFGLEPVNLGCLAYFCGCFGRTMSPVAGVTIICASLSKVSPIDISKRAWPSSVLTAVIAMIAFGFIMMP